MTSEGSSTGEVREGDCLFCKVLAGTMPSKAVAVSDPALAETVYAFEDIHPAAPHHVLIVPRRHISSVNALESGDAEQIGNLVLAARAIAAERGLSDDGYRLVINTNAAAGQAVFHIHLHLLGGRLLTWPPG